MKKVGGNINKTDRASFIDDVTLNTSTAETIILPNPDRIKLVISNPSNRDIWLQFQDEMSVFSNSELLLRGEKYTMDNSIYFGEIKGIADIGTPKVTVLEY